jgi:cholesterol transport system auxiliary component
MIRHIAMLALVFSLGACVSFLPEPETPNALYRFGPSEEVAGLVLDRSVIIRSPEAPRILAGVEIATRDEAGAVRVIKGVEWADRAPRLLQLTLLDMLNGDGQGHALLPESGALADYQLAWRLAEFSLQDRTATASVEYVLIDGKTRRTLSQTMASVNVNARGSSAAERAEAMAEAGRQAVEAGARFLVDKLGPGLSN